MNKLLSIHRRLAVNGPQALLEKLLFLMLLPLSMLYGGIGWLRSKCYDLGLIAAYRAPVPVVSVGNLAAGGTGKTPVVDWLLKELVQLGKLPAVVSRGYGGNFSGRVGVVSLGDGIHLNAEQAGDEPVLLARRNSQAKVLIARRRADGVREAVNSGADVIILDDGFQHRAVKRDIDLVLLDAGAPYGNGWPLPAGLLREFPQALGRASMLLMTRVQDEENFHYRQKAVYFSRHCLAGSAFSLAGEEVLLEELNSFKLFAFAGIADPENFFSGLRDCGLSLHKTLALGDHCDFGGDLLQQINEAAKGCDILLTTEKDAVKLTAGDFALPCYQVPLVIRITAEDEFRTEIMQRLWSK